MCLYSRIEKVEGREKSPWEIDKRKSLKSVCGTGWIEEWLDLVILLNIVDCKLGGKFCIRGLVKYREFDSDNNAVVIKKISEERPDMNEKSSSKNYLRNLIF